MGRAIKIGAAVAAAIAVRQAVSRGLCPEERRARFEAMAREWHRRQHEDTGGGEPAPTAA
jgi:hypothetical protein